MPAPFETIPRMMAFLTRLGGSPAPKHGSAAAGGQMDGISLLFVIDRRSEGSNLLRSRGGMFVTELQTSLLMVAKLLTHMISRLCA